MSRSLLDRLKVPASISSWLTFAISLTLYWITVDPGASYWDCSEYVTVASKMEIGHPPGNPIWMLAMRVATIPFPPQHQALVLNLCSGLFMAFASFFLCRIILVFTRLSFGQLCVHRVLSAKQADIISAFIATGASLCFALCDSVWFSAVEAEVYAMSTFIASASLWVAVEYWFEDSRSRANRLLILLAYLTGLSLGVHQLNLLMMPVFGLIILYKNHPERLNPVRVFFWILAGVGIIGLVLMVFIPGVLVGAMKFELFGVNGLSLPYHSGVIAFGVLIFFLFIICLLFSSRFFRTPSPSLILWSIGFLLLGFSSFSIIMIRSQAYPPLNEGTPDNIFALASYISRDQYPSSPLLYGQTPFSQPLVEETFIDGKPKYLRYILEKGKPVYIPTRSGQQLLHRSRMLSHKDSLENERIADKGHGYVLSDYTFKQKLTPELNMWFPRITSRNPADIASYEDWAGMSRDNMIRVSVSETIDSLGQPQPKMLIDGNRNPVYSSRPTYLQNFHFFVSYQAYYMYFRYLFWNFIGRQNDYPSNGEIDHGNFITGFPFIDNEMLGDSRYFPGEIWKGNKGRNRYFAIPFILGLIGIIGLGCGSRSRRRLEALVALLFVMTGIAIVAYLNQSPGEPRERDYTFLCSYMAFTLWIAAGIAVLSRYILKLMRAKAGVWIIAIISICPATLMALENFDDHDRRGRYETTFFASSFLDFELPAIIFSHGDNSSFPLWYASEVLGMGPSHSPIDITYLGVPSYVTNLKKQGSKGISTVSPPGATDYGKYLLVRIPDDSVSEPIELNVLLSKLYEAETTTPVLASSIAILPDGKKINLHGFTKGGSLLNFRQLMLLDILSANFEKCPDNQKVLFFPHQIDHSFFQPLDSLLLPALFGNIYAPGMTKDEALGLLEISAEREVAKIKNQNIKPHYMEPVVADRAARYRGELIIAAKQLLEHGNKETPGNISDVIEEFYPYHELLPGSFTVADSTFYEGKEYLKLMVDLFHATGNKMYKERASHLKSLMDERHKEWLRYYNSLSSDQRQSLSNRSKRLLLNQTQHLPKNN